MWTVWTPCTATCGGQSERSPEKPGIKRFSTRFWRLEKLKVLPDVSHQKCAKNAPQLLGGEMTQATRPSLFFEDIFLEFPFLLTQIFFGKKRRLFPCISRHQISSNTASASWVWFVWGCVNWWVPVAMITPGHGNRESSTKTTKSTELCR